MGSFPDENPNPVLRIARDGTVLYANRASEPLLRTLDTARGERVPDSITAQLASAAEEHTGSRFELTADHSTYAILAVDQPDLDAWNVYGTDITGAKVVEKFPDRNPNPVLRASPDGALIYANTAASGITRALGTAPGELLPAALLDQIRERLEEVHLRHLGRHREHPSRLESHGVPGRIQITAGTADRLASGYVFELRGTVEIKGKGSVEACFLVARRKSPIKAADR
jgi:Adenylate and Guanylate cyclase catalytic domain